MADYRKYAENLVGDWQTSQYEPQRQTAQKSYQTNWNKLSNDFQTLKDNLQRNLDNARMTYANGLSNVQDTSFNRMNNINTDLANRGLTSSGVSNLYTQADTKTKGEDVNKLLGDLMGTTGEGVSSLATAGNKLASEQQSLAGDLYGTLGDLTSAEAGNAQDYANLLANLGQSASSRASSGSGSGKTKKEQETEDDARKIGIALLLADTTISDEDKIFSLINDYDVTNARGIIPEANKNVKYDELNNKINAMNTTKPYSRMKARKIQDKMNKNGRTDLYNLLYGNK